MFSSDCMRILRPRCHRPHHRHPVNLEHLVSVNRRAVSLSDVKLVALPERKDKAGRSLTFEPAARHSRRTCRTGADSLGWGLITVTFSGSGGLALSDVAQLYCNLKWMRGKGRELGVWVVDWLYF